MTLEETILGFLIYKKQEYPFYYRESILSLLPANQEILKQDQQDAFEDIFQKTGLSRTDKWIDTICLKGRTQDGYDINFYVGEDYSSDMGFISFSVQYIFYFRQQYLSLKRLCYIIVSS